MAAESNGIGLDLTTATGRGQARFMAAGAQMEVEIKVERQKLGHGRRVRAGRPFWTQRPFGFEKDGSHREDEAAHLRQAYSDVLAGHSLWSIAERWNEAGVLTARGGKWHSNVVRTILKHPRNAGIHTYTPKDNSDANWNWSMVPPQPSGAKATWEPIVPVEIWEAACTLFADPSRVTHGGGKRKGLLTGIVTCSLCGTTMTQRHNRPRQDGERLRKYGCRGCKATSIDANFLDDYVINQIIFNAPAIVASHLATDDADTSAEELTALRAEEVTLKRRKDELAEDYAEGHIDRDAMRAGTRRADERLAQLSQSINAQVMSKVSAERWSADIEAMFYQLDQLDDPAHHDYLREVINDVVVSVSILPRGKGKRFSGPEDVDLQLIVRNESPAKAQDSSTPEISPKVADAWASVVDRRA